MADNTQAPRCRVSQCGPSARKASGPVSKPTRPCSTCCPAPPPLTHCYSQWKGGPGSWHFLSGKGTHACLCASMCELAFSFCFSFQCCTKLTCLEIVCLKVVCVINLCNLTERQKCIYKDTVSGKTCVSPPRVQGSGCADREDLKWNQHARGHQDFALFPQLAPGLQMHRPRQGCTSLGSTERLLCSGSWSPDALIETLRPCRNQREGKGDQGRGCKHIWHLQNPAHNSHNIMRENVQATQQSEICFPSAITHAAEDTHTHTHIQLCAYYLYNLEK